MSLHKKGARQPDALNPDSWAIDAYAFSIAANRVFMSSLFMNLATNIRHYSEMERLSEGPESEDAHRLGTK